MATSVKKENVKDVENGNVTIDVVSNSNPDWIKENVKVRLMKAECKDECKIEITFKCPSAMNKPEVIRKKDGRVRETESFDVDSSVQTTERLKIKDEIPSSSSKKNEDRGLTKPLSSPVQSPVTEKRQTKIRDDTTSSPEPYRVPEKAMVHFYIEAKSPELQKRDDKTSKWSMMNCAKCMDDSTYESSIDTKDDNVKDAAPIVCKKEDDDDDKKEPLMRHKREGGLTKSSKSRPEKTSCIDSDIESEFEDEEESRSCMRGCMKPAVCTKPDTSEETTRNYLNDFLSPKSPKGIRTIERTLQKDVCRFYIDEDEAKASFRRRDDEEEQVKECNLLMMSDEMEISVEKKDEGQKFVISGRDVKSPKKNLKAASREQKKKKKFRTFCCSSVVDSDREEEEETGGAYYVKSKNLAKSPPDMVNVHIKLRGLKSPKGLRKVKNDGEVGEVNFQALAEDVAAFSTDFVKKNRP